LKSLLVGTSYAAQGRSVPLLAATNTQYVAIGYSTAGEQLITRTDEYGQMLYGKIDKFTKQPSAWQTHPFLEGKSYLKPDNLPGSTSQPTLSTGTWDDNYTDKIGRRVAFRVVDDGKTEWSVQNPSSMRMGPWTTKDPRVAQRVFNVIRNPDSVTNLVVGNNHHPLKTVIHAIFSQPLHGMIHAKVNRNDTDGELAAFLSKQSEFQPYNLTAEFIHNFRAFDKPELETYTSNLRNLIQNRISEGKTYEDIASSIRHESNLGWLTSEYLDRFMRQQ
jgi:hypothetical protein